MDNTYCTHHDKDGKSFLVKNKKYVSCQLCGKQFYMKKLSLLDKIKAYFIVKKIKKSFNI